MVLSSIAAWLTPQKVVVLGVLFQALGVLLVPLALLAGFATAWYSARHAAQLYVNGRRQQLMRELSQTRQLIVGLKPILHHSIKNRTSAANDYGAGGGWLKAWAATVKIDKTTLLDTEREISRLEAHVGRVKLAELESFDAAAHACVQRIADVQQRHARALRYDQDECRRYQDKAHDRQLVAEFISRLLFPVGPDYRHLEQHPFTKTGR